jgi:hypothetical protein
VVDVGAICLVGIGVYYYWSRSKIAMDAVIMRVASAWSHARKHVGAFLCGNNDI